MSTPGYRGWSSRRRQEIPFQREAVEEFLLKTTVKSFGELGIESCYVLTSDERQPPTVYAMPAEIEECDTGYDARLSMNDDERDPRNCAMRFRATAGRLLGTTPFPVEHVADARHPAPTEVRRIGGVRIGRTVDGKAVEEMNSMIEGVHKERLHPFLC